MWLPPAINPIQTYVFKTRIGTTMKPMPFNGHTLTMCCAKSPATRHSCMHRLRISLKLVNLKTIKCVMHCVHFLHMGSPLSANPSPHHIKQRHVSCQSVVINSNPYNIGSIYMHVISNPHKHVPTRGHAHDAIRHILWKL